MTFSRLKFRGKRSENLFFFVDVGKSFISSGCESKVSFLKKIYFQWKTKRYTHWFDNQKRKKNEQAHILL